MRERAEHGHWPERDIDRAFQVGATAEGETGRPARTDIEDELRLHLIEPSAMVAHLSQRAPSSRFLAGVQHESQGASGAKLERTDLAGGVDHQCDVASVIQSTSAQLPAVEVGAEDDELVRSLTATNFRHHVSSPEAWKVAPSETQPDLCWVPAAEHSNDTQRTVPLHHRCGKRALRAIDCHIVPVEQAPGSIRHPENARRAGSGSSRENWICNQIFFEK